jgi:hypothetical protein
MGVQHMKVRNMNRHQRRLAQKRARHAAKNGDSHIVAVHEAGHALAKVLAAGELGYSINEAINHIDMGTGEKLGQSVDGRMITTSQGVTFGPAFSRDIETASHEFKRSFMRGRGTLEGREANEFWSKVIELGRAAGADIGKWFRARVFIAVSGSIAEAIFCNRTFNDVWYGYEADSDLQGVISEGRLAEIGADEAISTVNRMAVVTAHLMEKPEVWQAVLALANKLPALGRMDGAKATAIITGVIPETDLTGMFGEALEGVAELEREITAARVVVVETPDGPKEIIKGKELVQKAKDAGINSFEVIPYQCTFPVFAETLWHAFGDGNASREGVKAA